MWDLPRPGLEPVSPALAGRLSTTAPPGKPDDSCILNNHGLDGDISLGADPEMGLGDDFVIK